MGVKAILDLPFVQVALPIVITFAVAMWYQNGRFTDLRSDINRRFDDINRRFDDMNRRFDRIDQRLERIEGRQEDQGNRITRLEERTSILHP